MTVQLHKHLRFWDSVAISVGIVIGVGIFRTPAQIAKYLDSPQLILIAWLVGAAISLLGVLCYAELSSQFPHTGGTYVYLREAYGKFVGFIYGWAEFSINRAASIAAVAYILAAYLRNFLPYTANSEKWIALGAVILFTCVNMVGIHYGVKVQNVLSIFKVLAMVSMAGAIILFAPYYNPSIAHASSGFSLKYFAPALIPILWSYGGWHESTFMSAEFKDTQKELPRSLIISALIVAGLYLLMNYSYLQVFSPQEMVHSKAIASDALQKLFGSKGAVMISIAIIVSASGALNSNILTGARVPFAVGQDTKKLEWIGKVHSKFKTPIRSLAINAVWACILILWGNFERLLFFNAFEIWLFFILAGLAVFILRRKMNHEMNFAMIGYPYVPFLFTIVSIWLCVTTILEAPQEALFGSLIILLGVPIYFLTSHRSRVFDKSVV